MSALSIVARPSNPFSTDDVGYSQHEDFEESTEEVKPLTEEEKAAHLEMLKQKYTAITDS